MTLLLKIKIKSLAEEVRIIKNQEQRMKGPNWGSSFERASLRQHRLNTIRPEIRDTLLAYGYLRGRCFLQVEASSKSEPNWDNVKRMVKKYGTFQQYKDFDVWRAVQPIAA